MKQWLSKKSNLFTLILLAFLAWRQIPLIFNNLKAEGVKLESQDYKVISSATALTLTKFPPEISEVMVVFWATWCAPCKVEMHRLQSSVGAGKISGSKIVAINPFEAPNIVKKFLVNNHFDFTFIDAPDVAHQLKIEVTPTTIFIDKGRITSMSTGMSVFGIWKAESFLNPN